MQISPSAGAFVTAEMSLAGMSEGKGSGPGGSAGSGSDGTGGKPSTGSQRRKYCAKCKKHNLMREFKGHKNRCYFRWCYCPLCEDVETRRKTSRTYVKQRRDAALELELAQRRNNDMCGGEGEGAGLPVAAETPPLVLEPPAVLKEKLHQPSKDLDRERRAAVTILSPSSPPRHVPKKALLKDQIEFDRKSSLDNLSVGGSPPAPREVQPEEGYLRSINPYTEAGEAERRSVAGSLSPPEAMTTTKEVHQEPTYLRPSPVYTDRLEYDRRSVPGSLSPPDTINSTKEIIPYLRASPTTYSVIKEETSQYQWYPRNDVEERCIEDSQIFSSLLSLYEEDEPCSGWPQATRVLAANYYEC